MTPPNHPTQTEGRVRGWTECYECGWNLATSAWPEIDTPLPPGAGCPDCGEPVVEVWEAAPLRAVLREWAEEHGYGAGLCWPTPVSDLLARLTEAGITLDPEADR